jgi:hypothetical protein
MIELIITIFIGFIRIIRVIKSIFIIKVIIFILNFEEKSWYFHLNDLIYKENIIK